MTGTLINTVAVVAGTLAGLALKERMPEKTSRTVIQGIGIFTIFMGISMAMETRSVLVALFSVVLGSVVGSILDIERRLDEIAAHLETRLARNGLGLARGFVAASLLFCVGPMAVLGSIEDGLSGNYRILVTKSMMDGFCSIAFGATFGVGVALSAASILVYQGGLTVAASAVKGLLTDATVREMSATGGLLVAGIGIDMLELRKIHVGNMLPAIAVAAVLARVLLKG